MKIEIAPDSYPLDNQLRARAGRWRGIIRRRWQTLRNGQVPDSMDAHRTYSFECPVANLVQFFGDRGSYVAIWLGDYPGQSLSMDRVTMVPDAADRVSGPPVAEVRFTGWGPRHGPLHYCALDRVTIFFRNKDHMAGSLERLMAPPEEPRTDDGGSSSS